MIAKLLLALALIASPVLAQEHGSPAPHVESHEDDKAAAAPHGETGAAGHGEQNGHANSNEMLWRWVNFAILAGGIGYLLKKFAGPFFTARTAAIRSGIAEARQMKADADARAAEIERRIGNLGAEIEQLRAGSRAEIGAEAERVRAETEAQIAKVQAQAEAEIAAAGKTAQQELKAHAAQLAIDLAEQQLKARVGPAEQGGLVRAFIKDLEARGNGKGPLS